MDIKKFRETFRHRGIVAVPWYWMGECGTGIGEHGVDEKVLKALGDPKRFLLLQLMSERGYCVRALAQKSCLSESAVSQHLRILREAGLVYGVKKGYYTHYRLDKEVLDRFISELAQIRDAKRQPCGGPYHGCPESEHLKCKNYYQKEKGSVYK